MTIKTEDRSQRVKVKARKLWRIEVEALLIVKEILEDYNDNVFQGS